MDFVRSHFGKMQLWPVKLFWLTFFLVRVAFFRGVFLQNPYFRSPRIVRTLLYTYLLKKCKRFILVFPFFAVMLSIMLSKYFRKPNLSYLGKLVTPFSRQDILLLSLRVQSWENQQKSSTCLGGCFPVW